MTISSALNTSSARPSLPIHQARALAEQIKAEIKRRADEAERQRVLQHEGAIRAGCETLAGFVREFWTVLEPVAPLKWGWALDAMCAHLEAVTRGDIKRLLITVPPGMMKSLILVFWTAWEWGPKGAPHIQVLSTSYSQANTFRDNMKLRDLVKSAKFQALWPLAIRDDADAKGKFINTSSGFAEARPFSKMTGGRANRVKIDDPHDTEGAESPVQRGAAVRIMREAISDRLNNPVEDAIVLIMQRLHEQDCAATAISLGYTHLELPMEFEPARRCVTVLRPANDGNPTLLFEDPRTEDGELLFPERFPRAEVEGIKAAKGSYAYAGQYQQRPAPRDGGMFKRAWFGFVGALPADIKARTRAWDLGATEGGGDYTVGVKLARDPRGVFYIEHVARDQLAGAGVERLIKNTADQDGRPTRIRLPQDPGAAGKAYAATLVSLLAGYDVKATPPTGDKETRAKPAEAQAEVGNVKLLMTGDPARDAWIEPFLAELCMFPAGAHDDQVDAFADALNDLALAPAPFVWSVGGVEIAAA